ncbi:MAG: hypothetical protein IKM44_03005 [Clostridia bacterium]|nr:hypothetical protein [Clostridia bacterium]
MPFNPFNEKPEKTISFENWKQLNSIPYDKNATDAYTKVRIILMNGTEFESQWFLRNMSRHVTDNDLRRDLAVVRRQEQQQQKKISSLKPKDESILEHTIAYEQLAVDLTALMAQNEPDDYVRKALDFALLEDFDHLYRYADLLEMDMGIKAEKLVGKYTEIMPGRPTVSEHRYPLDDIKRRIDNRTASPLTKLHAMIITAAEQQTMNYYMNQANFYDLSDLGRKLYNEIAMIEEQHVSMYESLCDSSTTWLECMLMHEYTECYLYYSMMQDECDERIKKIWEDILRQEINHLHNAARLLRKYEGKEWQQVIPDGNFPELISFSTMSENNKNYVRKVLKNTVNNTADRETWINVDKLPETADFFKYNKKVNGNVCAVASHKVIDKFIMEAGEDYRFQEKEHPVKCLRCRKEDNVNVGRIKMGNNCGASCDK